MYRICDLQYAIRNRNMSNKGKLVVITGPSGVGKSTIVGEVQKRTGAVFSVSATTRKPRPDEHDRKDYCFVDDNTFQSMVETGEMLEWAEVFHERYGTPAGMVAEAVENGKTVLLEIDVQGGLQIKKKVPDATFILIAPPTVDVLAKRLDQRGSETDWQRNDRLAKAEQEIRAARESGIYEHEVINDDLDTAIREVVNLVRQEQGPK